METSVTDWLPRQGGQPKMLVVDDQAVNIRLIYDLFKDDCDLFMARDGAKALEQARAIIPDLILLDVMLPDINGYEICEILKRDPATEHVPIIFITANVTEEDEATGFNMGAVDFIRKPINPVITRARVRTHLLLKKQAQALERVALTDALTGLANRRAFEQEYEQAWRQCARENWSIGMVLIDIDFFKRYNDRYGHQGGDDCLRLVAKAMAQVLQRPGDVLARYGGEEFACVLSNTDLQGACHIGELFRQAVESLGLPHLDSTVAKYVTLSVGIASIVPSSDTDEEGRQLLISAADKRLYQAKERGRNQVCS
ncbi:diguanylate cyclase domain-containing protein [Simiduia aestuariiviva]|uniref:diguanylate cyclase n=1 Tax=Simiduia aestuariiviva TaxID=1510459 RepID=A0A839UHL7_9GAMM|nr:diguanylate cyclase (GGDEF)-like protein [Simiduia aestuariiviva]